MTTLSELKEDFKSKGYQDPHKWMMRCKELIAQLEDAEKIIEHEWGERGGENPNTRAFAYFKKYGEK